MYFNNSFGLTVEDVPSSKMHLEDIDVSMDNDNLTLSTLKPELEGTTPDDYYEDLQQSSSNDNFGIFDNETLVSPDNITEMNKSRITLKNTTDDSLTSNSEKEMLTTPENDFFTLPQDESQIYLTTEKISPMSFGASKTENLAIKEVDSIDILNNFTTTLNIENTRLHGIENKVFNSSDKEGDSIDNLNNFTTMLNIENTPLYDMDPIVLESSEILDDSSIQSTTINSEYELTTTKVNFDVDYCDEKLNSKDITRVASYEANSLATVTRSATVTSQIFNEDDITTMSSNFDITERVNVSFDATGSEKVENSKVLPLDKFSSFSNEEPEFTNIHEMKREKSNLTNTFSNNVNTSSSDVFFNRTNTIENNSHGNHSLLFQNTSKVEMVSISENSDSYNLNSLIPISIVSCLVFAILMFITFMWYFRRHKNQNKVYLSFESPAPKVFLTKPMTPACLLNELQVNIVMPPAGTLKPSFPVILLEESSSNIEKVVSKTITRTGSEDSGLDNLGFVEIPLEDDKSCKSNAKTSLQTVLKAPPKYKKNLKRNCELKVWSSSGSLYSASSLTRCNIPPPDYLLPPGSNHILLEEPSLQKKWNDSRKQSTPTLAQLHTQNMRDV